MPLELVTLPCLADNYAYLIHDPVSGATGVVDVPDAAPILAELQRREWGLSDIFLTHHHDDHIAGVKALRAATGAKFGQREGRGGAKVQPVLREAEAQQFTEHLADFGGGGEISGRAKGIARGVIAVVGMQQAVGHVIGQCDRPRGGDATPQ